MVDTVVLVVRAGQGRRNNISSVIEILNGVGANLRGAVVTDMSAGGFRADANSKSDQQFNEQETEYGNVPV